MVQGEVNVVKGEFLIGFRLGRHYQVGIVFYIQLLYGGVEGCKGGEGMKGCRGVRGGGGEREAWRHY